MKRALSYSPTEEDGEDDDYFMAYFNLGEDTDAPAATTMPDMAPDATNMPAVPEVAPATTMPAVPEDAPATTMPHGTHPPDMNAEQYQAAIDDGYKWKKILVWLTLATGWSYQVQTNQYMSRLHDDLEQWRLEAGCLASAMASTTLDRESWQRKYDKDLADFSDLAFRFNALNTLCSRLSASC